MATSKTEQVDEADIADLGALIDRVVIEGTTFVILRDDTPVAVLSEYR